jgi:hypothetical protein
MAATFALIYPFVEGFLTVYLLGTAGTLFLRQGNPLPPAWLGFCVLLAAYVAAHWKFRRKHGRTLQPGEHAWAVLCTALIHLVVSVWIAQRLAIGAGGVIRLWYFVLGVPLLQIAFVAPLARWIIGRAMPEAAPSEAQDSEAPAPRLRRPVPIAASVGFVTIGTSRFGPERQADETVIGDLFAKRAIAPEGKIPQAQVLFVYAELLEDGTIGGLPFKSSIRQIVQLTGAQIVVVASAASAPAIQAAAALEGPKTANIVFTIDRKGPSFGRFFSRLFREMAMGKDMLQAWVALCPQGPASDQRDTPVTILLAEGGKLAFAPAPQASAASRPAVS